MTSAQIFQAAFCKTAVLGFKALTGHTGPVKALLRQLRQEGVAIKRVKPEAMSARLPHTESLPVGVSQYSRGFWNPAKDKFNNVELSVQKGLPRTTFSMSPMPDGRTRFAYTPGVAGGTNPSPLASLFHEAGHNLHHTAMRRAGVGDMLGGHLVPDLPHMDKVLNELGANNAALQFLQRSGASPEAMKFFQGARRPSFRTYLQGLPQTNSAVQQRIIDVGQNGFTPGFTGLPELYRSV